MRPIFSLPKLQEFAWLLAARASRFLVLIFSLLLCSAAAHAQLNLDVTTNGSGSALYTSLNSSAGPFPFSNFGVGANSSLTFGGVSFSGGVPTLIPGTSVDLAGSTAFQLPTFTAGTHLLTNSTISFDFTPTWTSGSVNTATTVTANAGFQYNLGPFSGSKSIYSQALTINATGNLVSGGSLTGGTALANGTGQNFSAGYSLSAFAASASANLVVGANVQSSLSYSPTAQYGYYTWTSSTPTGAPTGLTFVPSSGGTLDYTFPSPGAPDDTPFYLNFLPAVQFSMGVDPSATFTVPLSGNLSAEALGQTLASYTFPIGTLLTENDTANFVNYSFDWTADQFESIPLVFNYCDVTAQNGGLCDYFQVQGAPLLEANNIVSNSSSVNFSGLDISGGFNPADSNLPALPPVCDFTGPMPNCYASNDPNMPTGPGTVSFTSTPIGSPTPEPGSLALLGSGLLGAGFLIRRRRS